MDSHAVVLRLYNVQGRLQAGNTIEEREKPTLYNPRGTTRPKRTSIQIGPYSRKNCSAHLLDGFTANHLCCRAFMATPGMSTAAHPGPTKVEALIHQFQARPQSSEAAHKALRRARDLGTVSTCAMRSPIRVDFQVRFWGLQLIKTPWTPTVRHCQNSPYGAQTLWHAML